MKAPENSYYKPRPKKSKKRGDSSNPDPLASVLASMGLSQEDVVSFQVDDPNYVKELLAETKKFQKQQQLKALKDERDAEILRCIVAEYMSSFIIVGYNCDDNRVVVKSTNSDKEDDALIEELRYVFFRLAGGNGRQQ